MSDLPPFIRPDLEFRLTAYNNRGFQYASPEPAYLCDRCGAVVTMPYVHQGFHDRLVVAGVESVWDDEPCPHDCETGIGGGQWRCEQCGRIKTDHMEIVRLRAEKKREAGQ